MSSRKPKSGLIKRAASIRLTLWLLFALAAGSAVGTGKLIPQNLEPHLYAERLGTLGSLIVSLGLDSYYTSIPFRALFALLMVNLAACALGRSVSGVRSSFAQGAPNERAPLDEREKAAERLRAAGYRVKAAEPLRATRRGWVFWGFPLVHLAPVLIVGGALWGTVGGQITTQHIHVGSITESVFDWKTREQVALPFALQVNDLQVHYHYPLQLLVKAVTDDGVEQPEVQTREGEPFVLPGTGYGGEVERFDPVIGDMFYYITRGDERWGPFSKGREEGAPIRLRPEAFKGEERRPEAHVTFFGPTGEELGRAIVTINEPVTVMDYRVFLTAWREDEEGRPFAGFQITRDPAQLPLWVGGVLMTAGLFIILFARGSWVREEEGQLVGRASRERRVFARELKALAGGDER